MKALLVFLPNLTPALKNRKQILILLRDFASLFVHVIILSEFCIVHNKCADLRCHSLASSKYALNIFFFFAHFISWYQYPFLCGCEYITTDLYFTISWPTYLNIYLESLVSKPISIAGKLQASSLWVEMIDWYLNKCLWV